MTHNVRKFYYIPYPSMQPRKRGYCVVMKSNPTGHIENDDVTKDVS